MSGTPLDVRPTDRPRLPPGQTRTDRWPVLHYGRPARAEAPDWSLFVRGRVEAPLELGWEELMEVGQREVLCDIHCVTGWSRLDVRFTGVPLAEVVRRARPRDGAAHVLVHATDGWTTNLPLEVVLRDGVVAAHAHAGEPLSAEHGG
ncbi:MAG TPA: molybdopterin-dependent oxidoreductase, partial [Gemmatimonadota bacterium]|nr:molybdopterin-dependent oxidoreductase [Gemmatimonadota bacterium]